MKKYVCFFMTVIFCIFGNLFAKADVIWEPEDPFFKKHSEEMEYISRIYTANGPDGKVILYESPKSSKVIDTWENGKTVNIAWIYEDSRGIIWGANDSGEDKDGWVPMEYMQLVYDSIAFQSDFADEITEETGTLDKKYEGENICLWDYPGAENCFSIEVSEDMELPSYDKVYKDDEGRSWGNTGYYYGYKDVWFCIDFPQGNLEQLYPDGAPKYETQQEEKVFGSKRIVPQTNSRTMIYITILLVCLTVLVTAALLMFLKKKKTVICEK